MLSQLSWLGFPLSGLLYSRLGIILQAVSSLVRRRYTASDWLDSSDFTCSWLRCSSYSDQLSFTYTTEDNISKYHGN